MDTWVSDSLDKPNPSSEGSGNNMSQDDKDVQTIQQMQQLQQIDHAEGGKNHSEQIKQMQQLMDLEHSVHMHNAELDIKLQQIANLKAKANSVGSTSETP